MINDSIWSVNLTFGPVVLTSSNTADAQTVSSLRVTYDEISPSNALLSTQLGAKVDRCA